MAMAQVVYEDTIFRYQYFISNDPASEQPLEVLRIEVGDKSSRIGGSLRDFIAPDHWMGWSDLVVPLPINPLASSIIIWNIADTISSIDELYFPPANALFPGSSFGLSFKSQGLPNILRFLARGWARPLTTVEYDSLRAIGIPHVEIVKPWYEDTYVGKTIAPAIPPTPFNALTFLDTITSYISESRTLGWITNDPTANKYKRLIDTARFHLQANNRGVTKAKLDSVLVNVYPDSAAGLITSEAYALLRFNTEYLLKKLSEEEERLDGKNK